MSNLLIYKASAGSGKTFQLTRQYLEMLLRDEKNYSSILAVTFTNKAASELKDRVLRELVAISSGELSTSDHYQYLSTVLNRQADLLVPRAKRILNAILLDYGRFSIGTIDEFFQTVLRGFAKDMGIYSGYTLELNPRNILTESVNRIIDRTAEDKVLFEWVLSGISEKIDEGHAWRRFEKELEDLGYELLKEKLSVWMMQSDQETFSASKIKAFREKLDFIEKAFVGRMSEISATARTAMEKAGINADEFKGKNSSPASYLLKLSEEKYDPLAKRNAINDELAWVTKTMSGERRNLALQLVEQSLNSLLAEAVELFDTQFPTVQLARKVRKRLFLIGLASVLAEEMINLSKERGLFLISLTNPIIASLVKDNPAPFIFERTGKYYSHYMIDEFQDTSNLQWNNFLPLLRESLSSGGKALLVGDAKQSIYRWRNSNWKLIASLAERDLLPVEAKNINLTKNFRSRQSLVDFNNQFFMKAVPLIKEKLRGALKERPELAGDDFEAINDLYSQVIQDYGSMTTGGYVSVKFIEKQKVDGCPAHFSELVSLIENLQLEKGYAANDIVFLCRTNREADEIVTYFVRLKNEQLLKPGCCYDVVSAESLSLDSSPVIRALTAFLRLMLDPDSGLLLGRFALEFLLCRKEKLTTSDVKPLMKGSREEILSLCGLSDLEEFLAGLPAFSVEEVIECVLRKLHLYDIPGALPFILSYKEGLRSVFGKLQNPGIKELLKWYEEEGGAGKLSMDETVNAMRVLSIHKAKGLEFPVVIMPDGNWDFDHNSRKELIMWLKTEGTMFKDLPIIPVPYHGDLINTFFAPEYAVELTNAYLDNLNLLYVAFTRAIDRLHVYIPQSGSKTRVNTESILHQVTQPDDESGLYDFGDPETSRRSKPGAHRPLLELQFQLSQEGIFRPMGSKPDTPELRRGAILHKILENVITLDTLEEQARKTYREEGYSEDETSLLVNRIKSFLNTAELQPLFSGEGKVSTEQSFLVPGYGEIRIDRIVQLHDRLVVVEYKSGKQQKSHHHQVNLYLRTLRDMGHKRVEGMLLYLDEESIVRVQ